MADLRDFDWTGEFRVTVQPALSINMTTGKSFTRHVLRFERYDESGKRPRWVKLSGYLAAFVDDDTGETVDRPTRAQLLHALARIVEETDAGEATLTIGASS